MNIFPHFFIQLWLVLAFNSGLPKVPFATSGMQLGRWSSILLPSNTVLRMYTTASLVFPWRVCCRIELSTLKPFQSSICHLGHATWTVVTGSHQLCQVGWSTIVLRVSPLCPFLKLGGWVTLHPQAPKSFMNATYED